MSRRIPFSLAALFAMALVLVAAAPSNAEAATRFAEPGGNGPSPCVEANPCSLFTAASSEAPAGERVGAGGDVVALPGRYSALLGDLGPSGTLVVRSGVHLHGRGPGQRPVLTSANKETTVLRASDAGTTVSDLEIETAMPLVSFDLGSGAIGEGLIVENSRENGIACEVSGSNATLRNSACLSSGQGGTAASVKATSATPTESTTRFRGVTATATGAQSKGISFLFNKVSGIQDIVSTIADGEIDIEASATNGAVLAVVLHNSDFMRQRLLEGSGGTVEVSEARVNGNVAAAPLLAADGIHQLPGSPTLGRGATDGFSGTTDIDGDPRVEGVADIGADELARGVATTGIACEPAVSTVGTPVTCTARVEGAAGLGAPTGFVTLSKGGAALSSCKLGEDSAQVASCETAISPQLGNGQQIVAEFGGDEAHRPGSGTTTIDVNAAPPAPVPPAAVPPVATPAPAPAPPLTPAPNTLLKRHPKPKSASQKAKFTFGANQTGARFQCKVDGKAYRSCRSPFKAKVKPGHHVFRVRAVGPGGTDLTPATFRWTVLG